MHEVVHGLEIVGARRPTEARMRGRQHLGAPAEQPEEWRPRVDVLRAVQEQQRAAGPAADDLQVDACDGQPLDDGRIGHGDHDRPRGGATKSMACRSFRRYTLKSSLSTVSTRRRVWSSLITTIA